MFRVNTQSNRTAVLDKNTPELKELFEAASAAQGKPVEATLTVKLITTSLMDRVYRGAIETETDGEGKRTSRVMTFAARVNSFVECVTEWTGFADEKGNLLPCERETKRLIAEANSDLCIAATNAIDRLSNEGRVEDKDELGNSAAPGNGSST